MRVLVTGSSGLIGSALAKALSRRGHEVRCFDLRRNPGEDVRIAHSLYKACHDVNGVIHLAAVSRVVWAHRDPVLCTEVNVGGVRNLCSAVRSMRPAPWVLFASSREVYGQQDELPAREDAELRPCNNYARSKASGEEMVTALREQGVVTAIARFSNVYGSTADHPDRVVPAFARAAAHGGRIHVEGTDNVFDFTCVSDVTRGVLSMVEHLSDCQLLPPIHFTTGRGVTLGELAHLAKRNCTKDLEVHPATPRSYDVSRFFGSTERAREILGWSHLIPIEEGFASMVRDFQGAAFID